jgi:hypothetical protein
MKINFIIRALGVLDLYLICWNVLRDIMARRIPFVSDFQDSIQSSQDFGVPSTWSLAIAVLANIAMFSLFFSGYWMTRKRKIGVYISLLQAPLRLFLIMPPTFYFLGKLSQWIYIYPAFVIAGVYVLEVGKIFVQILWIQKERGKPHST